MTAREWKPGQVAHLTLRTGRKVVAICFQEGIVRDGSDASAQARWSGADGSKLWSSVVDARPLVVIDPEDEDAAFRLIDLYFSGRADHLNARAMQAALREFADPKPRIEEPTGLGAVVEDTESRKFVRVADPIDGWMAGKQWQRIGGDINAVRNFGWSELRNVVRVLSEGVTP